MSPILSSTWTALAPLAGMLLAPTAIGLVGLLALLALPRASAAVRHLLALATLAAMLATPIVSRVLPAWRLPLLRAPIASAVIPTPASRDDAGATLDRAGEPVAAPLTGAPTSPTRAVDPAAWLGFGVVAGSLLLLARAMASLLGAARLVRGAAACEDARLLAAHRRASARLGTGSATALVVTPRVRLPLLVHFARPTIVLPVEAHDWTDDRLAVVLLHELAHVERRDVLALALVQLVSAVAWFHPLVWLLARIARRECERACDDRVLGQGIAASAYAGHLLAIAHAATGAPPEFALALARRATLETRLRSVLRAGTRRSPASPASRLAIGVAMLVVAVPLATVRVVAAPARVAVKNTSWAYGVTTTTRSTETGKTAKRETWKSAPGESSDPTAQVADPGAAADAYQRGHDAYKAKHYDEGAAAYARAAAAGEQTAKAWYNAACCYALAGQKGLALGAVTRAVDAGFDDLDRLQNDRDLDAIRDDARFRLLVRSVAHSESRGSERDDAATRMAALSEHASQDPAEWRAAAEALLRSGDPASAAIAYQHEIALQPTPSEIYNLACALARARQCDRALAQLQNAIVAGYGSADKLREDADLASLRNTRRFEELVTLVDDLSLRMKDDGDRAGWQQELPRYERVVREHPDFGRAWHNLGYTRLRVGDASGAREAWRRALALDYRRANTLYNLACASAQLSDGDASLQYLEQARAAGLGLEGALASDHDFDPIRGDDRFRALIAREAAGKRHPLEPKQDKSWK